MRLSVLAGGDASLSGEDREITGLATDSRRVCPGDLFAAIRGTAQDGAAFIPEARARGAVALLVAPGDGRDSGLPRLESDNPRHCLARLAARLYGPAPAWLAAVTGTNGKSSVVSFSRQLCQAGGLRAAAIGTLGLEGPADLPADLLPPDTPALTTPDPVTLSRLLAGLARRGVTHLALEASSHGLEQGRLDGYSPAAAVLSSFGRDHLDYHGSVVACRDAKRLLFRQRLAPGGMAIINADAPVAGIFVADARARKAGLLRYGRRGKELRLLSLRAAAGGLVIGAEILGRRVPVETRLTGAFQAHNLLAALGVALAAGLAADTILAAIPALEAPPGRMELAGRTAGGARVLVDYAHTPDALEAALGSLRQQTRGRLWVIFGCGGNRDPGKRPLMGKIAAEHADCVIVTDDNPRLEDPAQIRKAIMAGAPPAVAITEIGDRAAAIRHAIARLEDADTLLVAGKGHEQGQAIAGETRPFSDMTTAREALADRA